MSPDPNFIPPRLSEAIHLPGWIPGMGGIKSLKHKHRKRDKKEGRITEEKGRTLDTKREKKIQKREECSRRTEKENS